MRFHVIVFIALIFGRVTLTFAESAGFCPKQSVVDAFLNSAPPASVTEGDEISLQKALNMVHTRSHDYVALLFYASWCPFSRSFKPSFSILSMLYPSIPHFAIEESSVRPSIISKYGVHGFPTLLLINSTMRVRYQGSRTLHSFVSFYNDVIGIRTVPVQSASLNKIQSLSNGEKHDSIEQESCPFSWARSPQHLLKEETYLALATIFVLLRFLYIFFPTICGSAQYIWRGLIQNVKFCYLWERPQAFLSRAIQLFRTLKEPCKRRNLQEGAMNARAWASKSLASVSIGDASKSRSTSACEHH